VHRGRLFEFILIYFPLEFYSLTPACSFAR